MEYIKENLALRGLPEGWEKVRKAMETASSNLCKWAAISEFFTQYYKIELTGKHLTAIRFWINSWNTSGYAADVMLLTPDELLQSYDKYFT